MYHIIAQKKPKVGKVWRNRCGFVTNRHIMTLFDSAFADGTMFTESIHLWYIKIICRSSTSSYLHAIL